MRNVANHRGKRLVQLVVWVLLWLGLSGRVQAQEAISDRRQTGDYKISHKDWNGLSTLAALAEGSGLQVVERERIAWNEIDSNDIVFLLYPTRFVDPKSVVTFIRNGGRVLIADDFGAGAPMLSLLGGSRSGNIRAADYHDNLSFAPIARATGQHPLSTGVNELTTNHPSSISNWESMTSVFGFSDNSALVATGSIGAGQYVVLADPSVLINHMLQFEGNLKFCINLLRFLLRPEKTSRLVILSGNVEFTGIPRNQLDDGTLRGKSSVLVAQVDGWLDQLNTWLLTQSGLRLITIILALTLCVVVFFTVPRKPRRVLDGSWTRATSDEHQWNGNKSFELSLDGRASYVLPAAIARDNVNTALELALQHPDPLFLPETELLARTEAACGEQAAETLRQLLPKLRGIPPRTQAAAHFQPRYVRFAEFESLHAHTCQLFEQLKNR